MTEQTSERDLRAAFLRGDRILCVHYACENFFEVTDRPPAVTCLAIAYLGSAGQEFSYSLANALPSSEVIEREKDLLRRFYETVVAMPDARIVTWNMHSSNYGFGALGDRYRFVFGDPAPFMPQPDRLFDLDALVAARHGNDYAKHPKLRNLASLNGLYMPYFKMGKEEADAYKARNFGLIERSTAEKAHLLSALTQRLLSGELRTQNSVGAVEFAAEHLDAVAVVVELGKKFRTVERALRRRHANRQTILVTDEYDAQDLLRALLVAFFDDVRDEEWTPSIAGAAARIDFVLPEFGLAIEIKYSRRGLDAKKLGEELIVDRDRYQARKDVSHLVCLVFDHDGNIVNPRGIEKDLARDVSAERFAVTVRIFDR
jgi:hypothetical protein